jgi:hypothetical protein
MFRVLPLLALGFKLWMAIDAGRKRQPYYWFLIILALPFGDFVYFFVVKIHDYKWRKLASLFRSPPAIEQLKFRYRESPCLDNRMALAQALAAAGRHVEAIVEFDGICASRKDEPEALWGLALSRAALGELDEASATLERLLVVSPAYHDFEPWVMLAGLQHKRGLGAESLETLRKLVRKSARADHQMLLAEALIAADGRVEAAGLLDSIIEGHAHAPDYIRRRDRGVVGRARRLRADIERVQAKTAGNATAP